MKYAFFSLIFALVFIVAGLYLFRYYFGPHTKYCPIGHRMSDSSNCRLLDVGPDMLLLQHGNIDTHDYYLEIIDKGKSRKYQMPETALKNAVKGYRAVFIEGEDKKIMINDRETELIPLK